MRRVMLLALVTVVVVGLFAPRAGAQPFAVGGSIYTDVANPLTTGLAGVAVEVDGVGGTFNAVTGSGTGVWFVTDVPVGSYTVTPTLEGWCFNHVELGIVGEPSPITITVDVDHQSENLSLQFLATQDCAECDDGTCDAGENEKNCPEDCFCGNDTCDPGETSCNCLEDCGGSCDTGACCGPGDICANDKMEEACVGGGGSYLGDGLTCEGDADGDGVFGCDDVCPDAPAPGGVDAFGRPLGDLDEDCDVDLLDHLIMVLNFSGPLIP